MRINDWWEEPEPRISYDSYVELEKENEDLKDENYDLKEDLGFCKRFIRKFIEEGNKEGQTLKEAYARMFEYYKSEGYEEIISENKKENR